MERRKGIKRIVLISLAVLMAIGLAVGLWYLNRVNQYRQQVAAISYQDMDISALPDGVYTGSCDVDFVMAKVEVTIRGGALEQVRLVEHHQGRGQAAERITEDIVKEQRLDVDAVSGATNSSKVIKKAVEEALLQARDSIQ